MINSYQIGKKTLDGIARSGLRPTLLLHACCAPCSTYPLQLLNDYFEITVYFNNSNIYPIEEHDRRLEELENYLSLFNSEHNSAIKLIKTPYDINYMDYIGIRRKDPERGPRCHLCFVTRMKETYQYASDNHFDYFSTVMTISRQKDEQVINKIGLVLSGFFPNTKFLVHNFKKKGGQEIGLALTTKYNLYRQNYCGCKYSIKEEKKGD